MAIRPSTSPITPSRPPSRRRRLLAVTVAAALLGGCSPRVFEVAIGECVNLPSGDEVADVTAVDCAEPHDAEVYALPQHPDPTEAPYPGFEALSTFAEERCLEAFEGYVARDYASSALLSTALTPSRESWEEADDREIVCLLTGEDGTQLTGSKRSSGE